MGVEPTVYDAVDGEGEDKRYPIELVSHAVTRYGSRLLMRPIRPDDAPGLVEFHRRLSRRSIYRRYFFMHMELSAAEVEKFTRVDYVDRFAFVAEIEGQLVAVVRYDRSPGTTEAEVALVVADEYQHQGIATLLLEQLIDAAWKNGITIFFALTLVENREMLNVFRDMGFPVSTELDGGTVSVRFPIEPDASSRAERSTRHAGVA
jgi:GNAT superfamily N-acetyltransferase